METSAALALLSPRYASQERFSALLRECTSQPSLSDLRFLVAEAFTTEKARDALNILEQKLSTTERLIVAHKLSVLNLWSRDFPGRLCELENPPFVMFYKGHLPASNTGPWLATVGTRRPNYYGASVVRKILGESKTTPGALVSGLAFGIDACAHKVSLDRGIPNIAVLACGLDQIYPKEATPLAHRILDNGGALVSEALPGAAVYRSSFPWRNRVIAGLAHVVWVVQGTRYSGSKSTADHALKSGRLIAVTPGDVFSELSEAPHLLLEAGATPLVQPTDLDVLLSRAGVKPFD